MVSASGIGTAQLVPGPVGPLPVVRPTPDRAGAGRYGVSTELAAVGDAAAPHLAAACVSQLVLRADAFSGGAVRLLAVPGSGEIDPGGADGWSGVRAGSFFRKRRVAGIIERRGVGAASAHVFPARGAGTKDDRLGRRL